jgi:hypothetical protein
MQESLPHDLIEEGCKTGSEEEEVNHGKQVLEAGDWGLGFTNP